MAPAGYAADLPKSLKDTPEVEVLKHADFSGAYVGLALGGALLNDDSSSDDLKGVIGEIAAGYDFRRASLVIGPRIRGALTTMEDDTGLIDIDGYLNLGGRAGVVFNRTLVYGSVGYEFMFASSDNPVIDAALDDSKLRALTLGLGVETKIWDGITAGGEVEWVNGLQDAKEVDGFRGLVRINRHF